MACFASPVSQLALISTAPYDSTTASQLEEYVEAEIVGKAPYSFEVSKGLLLNYQANTDSLKPEVVAQILILALTRLPSTDLLTLSYLVPKKYNTVPSIKAVQTLSDLLERGQYAEFWTKYATNYEAVLSAIMPHNFLECIRSFIVLSLADTFRTISKELFSKFLGMQESDVPAFCSTHPTIIDKVTDDSVIFFAKASQQSKGVVLDHAAKVDEVLRIVDSLRGISRS